MHWIKAGSTPSDVFLVQNPAEVAELLALAFPNAEDPISGRRYIDVARQVCPLPPALDLGFRPSSEESAAPSIG